MESLQARIDSFSKSKRVKKSSKSNSASATVKWPHPSSFNANPHTLAEAGFYWVPSWEDKDSVACFLCHKELSDWDEEDDPFLIHWQKCGSTCAWAIVRCGLSEDIADDGSFVFLNKKRLPTSKAMEKARLQTFGEGLWPHDGQDDHGASSKKMAQGGFVYTPQTKGDDTVTCLYCNLSLGGWDMDDDPIGEHRKRDTKSGTRCPFFNASGSKPRTVSRARSKKGAIDVPSDPKHEQSDSGDELAKAEIVEEVQAPKTRRKGRAVSTSKPPAKAKSTGKKAPVRASKSALANPSEAEVVASESETDPIISEMESVPSEAKVDATAKADDTPVQRVRIQDDLHSEQNPSDVEVDNLRNTPHPPPRPETPHDNDAPMVIDETPQPYDPPLSSPPHPPTSLPPSQSPELAAIPSLQPETLTPEERCLTVEQWIRREIENSYEQLMQDGKKQISLFAGRAREVRQMIEAL
ncbi:inhibitor of apoptosis repeat-containing protein [Suillus brevipes Sb2]|nr:inhibitor of apoptosis repeat-containing protein [Suillus brevipes Sb2]